MTGVQGSYAVILSGIGSVVLGIVLLVGGLLVYRRAEARRAKMPDTIKWGAGLLVVQAFLIYLSVLLALGATAAPIPPAMTWFNLALATADLVFTIGLFNQMQWAWIGALVAQAIGVVVALAVFGLSAGVLGALLYPLVVVTILIQKSARSWVARHRSG
jgi:hypothetical protein